MIAVTGSTGQLGGRVAARLGEAGIAHRLVVRPPVSRAPLQFPGQEVAVAEYADAAAVQTALEGVQTVFMVSASEAPDRVVQHRAFVDGARAAGVGHVVYLSFVGARADATFTLARDHGATEDYLRARGMAWTFLRDNLYADFLPAMVGADGVIRGPAGSGRVAAVAQDDIADAAAAILPRAAQHAGKTYQLTGPEALTFAEIAERLSALDDQRPVRYQPETLAEAYASRASYGAPDWQVDAWVSTYTAIAAGELAWVSADVAELTGHPATPFPAPPRRQGREAAPTAGPGLS